MRDLSNDTSLLAINGATVRQRWTLPEIIDGCARYGIGGISPWRDQIEAYGLANAARQIREAGLVVNGICRGGMFPTSNAAAHKAMLDENRRAIDEAGELQARCLVMIAGGLPEGSKDLADAHKQVADSISELVDDARAAGVRLAIEPLHPMYAADRACVNTLKHALDICDHLGDDQVGVAIDVYHVWWDPELEDQIARAGRRGRIFGFHVCDWLVPTKDFLLDRGMMGDGVIDIPKIRGWVEKTGFDGMCEVEIFSAENWWKKDPDLVLRTCIERHKTVV